MTLVGSSGHRVSRTRLRTTVRHPRLMVGVAAVVLVLLAMLSLGVGSRGIDPEVVWRAIVAFDPRDDAQLVVRELRVPRTLLAFVVGPALGIAGALTQTLTRNPIADPGLLGINGGAAFMVAVGIVAFGVSTVVEQVAFACLGAALAGALVVVVGGVLERRADPARLVLSGAAISVVLLSATRITLINWPDAFTTYRGWDVGSLQGRGYEILAIVAVPVVVGAIIAWLGSRVFDSLLLGADVARSLGVDLGRVWATGSILVVVLCGIATAAAGPIAFVGLMAPHLVRPLVGVGHRRLIPASAVAATVILLLADLIGRVVQAPGEVGVGVVVGVIGGPVFVMLVRSQRLGRR